MVVTSARRFTTISKMHMVEYLIAQKVDIEVKNKRKKSAWMMAKRRSAADNKEPNDYNRICALLEAASERLKVKRRRTLKQVMATGKKPIIDEVYGYDEIVDRIMVFWHGAVDCEPIVTGADDSEISGDEDEDDTDVEDVDDDVDDDDYENVVITNQGAVRIMLN